MPGICSKSGKTCNFNSKPGKNLQLANSMFQAFQDVIYKNNSDILLSHIYIFFNTNTNSKPN